MQGDISVPQNDRKYLTGCTFRYLKHFMAQKQEKAPTRNGCRNTSSVTIWDNTLQLTNIIYIIIYWWELIITIKITNLCQYSIYVIKINDNIMSVTWLTWYCPLFWWHLYSSETTPADKDVRRISGTHGSKIRLANKAPVHSSWVVSMMENYVYSYSPISQAFPPKEVPLCSTALC